MKGTEIYVVSGRAVILGFWSHSGQKAIIFSGEALVWSCLLRNVTIFN